MVVGTAASILVVRQSKRWDCLCLCLFIYGIFFFLVDPTMGFIFQQRQRQTQQQSLSRDIFRRSQSSNININININKNSNINSITPNFNLPLNAEMNGNVDTDTDTDNLDDDDDDDISDSLFPLMKLASAHCATQAWNTAVQLKIPEILGNHRYSIQEICDKIDGGIDTSETAADNNIINNNRKKRKCNKDALLRTLRLLTTIDIVHEHQRKDVDDDGLGCCCFSLTKLGKCLRTRKENKPSMASCVQHWMEEPLWDSWLELPDYIRGEQEDTDITTTAVSESNNSNDNINNNNNNNNIQLPFERANGGTSSDLWYNAKDHPESLQHANDFVRLIHEQEIKAVAKWDFWSSLSRGKNNNNKRMARLVDIGGHNGSLMAAIAKEEPTIDCYCFDLPEVIAAVTTTTSPKPEKVTMVPGNVFDPNTIPPCDVILMKHFCDRSMWNDAETVQILRSCASVLGSSSSQNDDIYDEEVDAGNGDSASTFVGRIVIADAVLPDYGCVTEDNELALYLDALYMLVGRERQRTRMEWERLADLADLNLVGVTSTNVPSCSLIVLEKKKE